MPGRDELIAAHPFAALIAIALLWVLLLWPLLLVYAVHRFLRDFRRIANALEARAAQHPADERPMIAFTGSEGREAEGRIPQSAFGR